MAGFKHNYFQDFDKRNFYSYPDCEGRRINDYSFVIGDSVLKSVRQTTDVNGMAYHYEFFKVGQP
ncbi:MAG: hypothetical protein LBS52_07645 [Dysgonamonadaceae bacterium]|jgi:hypothetical protein|nr:hypothetical protein [Dysgonamonadaceae bacterium]